MLGMTYLAVWLAFGVVCYLLYNALGMPWPNQALVGGAALVVAGLYAIEHRRGDLEAERFAIVLADGRAQLQAAAAQLEIQLGLVDEELVLDDVARRPAVDRDDLVAGGEAGPSCR